LAGIQDYKQILLCFDSGFALTPPFTAGIHSYLDIFCMQPICHQLPWARRLSNGLMTHGLEKCELLLSDT